VSSYNIFTIDTPISIHVVIMVLTFYSVRAYEKLKLILRKFSDEYSILREGKILFQERKDLE